MFIVDGAKRNTWWMSHQTAARKRGPESQDGQTCSLIEVSLTSKLIVYYHWSTTVSCSGSLRVPLFSYSHFYSRQLSTEQAVLQESLHKETKVNKRLSMENEELLWKLHNGDLNSPRKLSPSSPSMTLQSPRHSGIFSSPPVSPR